ncbi:LytR/AlgR family response regulator transcription factor [Chitinophaga defluvii]|uniref:LytTR family DNA-binding domain-containing protein n=1 Tax=Chitinophaga defluvii TaxID=3163343 RepID=A0ABV2TAQ3_9BACT
MNTIRTVLIDDETDSIESMKLMLQAYDQVVVVGTFTSPVKALAEIAQLQPDLLFLDIEMPRMNGFELLEKIPHPDFQVVFATAYNQFAIKAFRFSALDYLVKPVNKEELDAVIVRAAKQHRLQSGQLQNLKQQLRQGHITKIAIPGQYNVTFIDIKDIVFAEASGNYSNLVLHDGSKMLITRKLKDIQEVLEEQYFLRIHRQYIINLNLVRSFNRNENMLTMITGDQMPVSRSQKDRLIEKYGWL